MMYRKGGICEVNSGKIHFCEIDMKTSSNVMIGEICSENRGTISKVKIGGELEGFWVYGIANTNIQRACISEADVQADLNGDSVYGMVASTQGTLSCCSATGNMDGTTYVCLIASPDGEIINHYKFYDGEELIYEGEYCLGQVIDYVPEKKGFKGKVKA